MDTIAASAKKLGKFLAEDFREIFGSVRNDEAEQLGALARITIECMAGATLSTTPSNIRCW
jgi:hypothetical protein